VNAEQHAEDEFIAERVEIRPFAVIGMAEIAVMLEMDNAVIPPDLKLEITYCVQ
jgi:hypothetical protein